MTPATARATSEAHATGDITTLDRHMGIEDAMVHDTLCALQAPSGVTRLADMMAAAGLRTQRGTAFNPMETRRVVERLIAAGHASRDPQGRLRATAPHGAARFVSMMHDAAQARRWFEAWCRLTDFERISALGFQEEEQLAASMRLIIFGGGALAPLERLGQRAYTFSHLWAASLQRAVLMPFDAALFSRLEPALQTALCDSLLVQASGFAESPVRPLEDWALAQCAVDAERLPPHLRLRLAETCLWRADAAAARALCAGVGGPIADLLLALVSISEGHWDSGAAAFEAATKPAGAALGRRKNIASPAVAWLYVMALLAQPLPAAWMRARKFVATELGAAAARRGGDANSLWGVWLAAIDQRLGDAPKDAKLFCLVPRQHLPMMSLQYLHHLLLAAWLRLPVAAPAKMQAHANALATAFDDARLVWLGRQVRRAAASLLDQAVAAADADAPFFVGTAQDRWREALASILALGGEAGAEPVRDGAAASRLIWVVRTGVDGRIQAIEPQEQKAGLRGLGKAKPVSLATLVKRKDLAVHDAALLRAVQREDYGNRPVLDIATAAPALVRHPHVAWHTDPARFVEVHEALPALEIMTRGEHIHFRLLDPVRDPPGDDAENEFLPQRWLAQRARLRQIMLLPDGDGRARLVRLTAAQLRVAELVSQGWQVPVAARTELDAAMRVLAGHFQVASDADAGHEVEASSLLHAELTPQGSGLALSLRAAPFGDFGPRLPPGQGRERVTTVHQGVTLSTRRDRMAELRARQGLLDGADFLDDEGHDWLLDEPDAALAVVEVLGGLSEGIVSEWPKGKPLRVRPVADTAVQLRANSKGQWLELDGELALDGGEVLRLRQLLDMAQASRSRYVALGEGDFLALSDALRQQLKDLDALAHAHKGGQRLSGVAALAWQASGHGLQLDGDTSWHQRSKAWAEAQDKSFDVPAGLAAELRDYQLEGYRWLMRLSHSGFGAVLADDMGLGKTLQTLAMLMQRAAGGPALVVAPTSVCGNWLLEAQRFAPGLRCELYGDALDGEDVDAAASDDVDVGSDEHAGDEPPSARRTARRRQVRALGPGQVLVCSYALLQIDAHILTAAAWHSVVLDEAQAIKNAATRRAKAALALQSDFRVALTGTPIENRLGELWSIMAFCNPGLLGSAEQFARHFGNPIERQDDPHIKAQVSRRLRRLLSPFLLRRTKAEVLTDLPPRTEIVHEVVPGARERALLEALRQQAEQSVGGAMAAGATSAGQGRFQMLAALMRLRRAACDPRLVAPELGLVGAKVQEFEQLALELVAGRHKALVFSQFTDFLALLRERLDAAGLHYQYLDGSTPAAERNKRIAAFQAGDGDLFLISLKAGGFGLNLTMADYVIITDPWWNPASEEQASARAHRIGQQRPVTVYRLVTQGSIEEKIVRLHRSKRDLAEGILSGEDAGAPIDAAQLMALLKAP